jgi:hypothetical protein
VLSECNVGIGDFNLDPEEKFGDAEVLIFESRSDFRLEWVYGIFVTNQQEVINVDRNKEGFTDENTRVEVGLFKGYTSKFWREGVVLIATRLFQTVDGLV